VRHPAGRAGRPWLAHRLAVARRSAEVLEEKRHALLRERQRLGPIAAAARGEWERRAHEAEIWLERAVVLGGQRQLEIGREAVVSQAEIEIAWKNVLGAVCPSEATTSPAEIAGLSRLGGSSALLLAAATHSRALEAAARFAVARTAIERIDAELQLTNLRRNALEHRWIPAHEEALAALNLMLDELEREDAGRVRWLTRDERAR
jgi:V/A-type H+-transporting ATPase subunit D